MPRAAVQGGAVAFVVPGFEKQAAQRYSGGMQQGQAMAGCRWGEKVESSGLIQGQELLRILLDMPEWPRIHLKAEGTFIIKKSSIKHYIINKIHFNTSIINNINLISSL